MGTLNRDLNAYLCFLKVWKPLSLPKLERLSVAGWKGTEWMKVDTEGESWNIYIKNIIRTFKNACDKTQQLHIEHVTLAVLLS